jgi:hypothetical protein
MDGDVIVQEGREEGPETFSEMFHSNKIRKTNLAETLSSFVIVVLVRNGTQRVRVDFGDIETFVAVQGIMPFPSYSCLKNNQNFIAIGSHSHGVIFKHEVEMCQGVDVLFWPSEFVHMVQHQALAHGHLSP